MESTSKFMQFMSEMSKKKNITDVKNDKTENLDDSIKINFCNRKMKGKNNKFGNKRPTEQHRWTTALSQKYSSVLDELNSTPTVLDENSSDREEFDMFSSKVMAEESCVATNVIALDDNDDHEDDDGDEDENDDENPNSDKAVVCVDEVISKTPHTEAKVPNAFEISVENIECKISVMDWIDSKVMKVTVRKFQPIATIFQSVAEKHGLPPSSIELEYESVTLSETDSPHSIGYVIGTNIEASRKTKNAATSCAKAAQPDANKIKLQFRSSESRYPITLALNPSDPMKIAMAIACERFELDPKRASFQFEGETIQFGDTAESLDMADDDVIDIEIR